MNAAIVGAACFGLVLGWVTYRTLIRNNNPVGLSDIATVLGAVGGAAVTGLFKDPTMFGAYSIGLAIGFFAFLIVFGILNGREKDGEKLVVAGKMGGTDQRAAGNQNV